MAKKHGESNRNQVRRTDAEIYALIRYLDPENKSAKQQREDTFFVLCVCIVILFIGFLAFACLWR